MRMDIGFTVGLILLFAESTLAFAVVIEAINSKNMEILEEKVRERTSLLSQQKEEINKQKQKTGEIKRGEE